LERTIDGHDGTNQEEAPMIWDQSEPFPPDPNAPQSPADRRRRQRLADEGPPSPAENADALDRRSAQVRPIGQAAGAELRRIVYGHAA
jgi:hypothetical protein